jgi:8-oxo-dGTP pyrophosphatase MutT (NUDIX family)
MVEKERKKLPVSVSAAVLLTNDKGELLLLQQAAISKGFKWGPPAGRIHPFEDPLMCVKRETKEEIGASIELQRLVGVYTVKRGEDASGIGFVFAGTIIDGEISPAKGEIMNYRFFSRRELEELIKSDKLYKPEYNILGIKDWLSGKTYSLEGIKPLVIT